VERGDALPEGSGRLLVGPVDGYHADLLPGCIAVIGLPLAAATMPPPAAATPVRACWHGRSDSVRRRCSLGRIALPARGHRGFAGLEGNCLTPENG
ncbi:MAG: hypothetical protein M1588_02430, partial [Planctomycetes bacterium]|nr:hypothetical protein [Planctomycetota bacterium]